MSDALAFNPTANPEAYVPWSGAERALAALERWAAASQPSVCLVAAGPGMGKTLLLKLLAARSRGKLRCVSLAYPDYDPEILRDVLLRRLGRPTADDSDAALVAAFGDPAGGARRVLLLVDEGELLSDATARWLLDLAQRAAGMLRIVIAVTRDDRCAGLVALFGTQCELVRISGAMSPAEVATHVRAELERAGLEPELRERFDARVLDELGARSEGVPAALRSLASVHLFEARRAQGKVALPALQPPRAATAPAPATEPAAARRPTESIALPAAARSRRAFALGVAVGLVAGIGAVLAVQRVWSPAATDTGDASHTTLVPAVSELRDVAAPAPIAAPVPEPAEPVLARAEPVAPEPAPAPPPVPVSLNAEPWAHVEVDGERVGETPIAEFPLPPGRHRFTARMSDGRVLEREVEIDASNRHVVFR